MDRRLKRAVMLLFAVCYCISTAAVSVVLAEGTKFSEVSARNEKPCGAASCVADAGACEDSLRPLIVIDAGHGGLDGGASAADGTQEKEINLAIAKYIKEIANEYAVNTIMTRESDEGLYTDDERSIREKKREDLKRRKQMMEQEGVTLGVSVHLNSFPQDEKVYGAQVFYPRQAETKTNVQHVDKTEETTSEAFAKAVQRSLEINIDDGRERSAMAKDDILLFKNTDAKLILVECGFLSNPREASLLKTAEYQRILAGAIWDGINEILCVQKTEKTEIRDSANKNR